MAKTAFQLAFAAAKGKMTVVSGAGERWRQREKAMTAGNVLVKDSDIRIAELEAKVEGLTSFITEIEKDVSEVMEKLFDVDEADYGQWVNKIRQKLIVYLVCGPPQKGDNNG